MGGGRIFRCLVDVGIAIHKYNVPFHCLRFEDYIFYLFRLDRHGGRGRYTEVIIILHCYHYGSQIHRIEISNIGGGANFS